MSINFGRTIEVDILGSNKLIEIRSLRVIFDVQDQTSDDPARGKIQIYNMNQENRRSIRFEKLKQINKFGDTIKIRAGYPGNIMQVYDGVIISAINSKVGPDWITTIEAQPEIARLLSAEVSQTVYTKGTPKITIFLNLLKDLNIQTQSTELTKIRTFFGTATISSSWTLFGSAPEVLSRLSHQWRSLINVRYQGNQVSLLPVGESLNEVPIEINKSNIIGSPSVIDSGLNFSVQMNPDITLQTLVSVESKTVDDLTTSGNYVAVNVNHRGDNREGDFITQIRGIFPNGEKGLDRPLAK